MDVLILVCLALSVTSVGASTYLVIHDYRRRKRISDALQGVQTDDFYG